MLTNYAYKLIPNQSQSQRMDNWVDMLRNHYNWNLKDRLDQYFMHYAEGSYCDLRIKAEMTPLTCCVSRYGATGEPWVENPKPKLNKETGELIDPSTPFGKAQDKPLRVNGERSRTVEVKALRQVSRRHSDSGTTKTQKSQTLVC